MPHTSSSYLAEYIKQADSAPVVTGWQRAQQYRRKPGGWGPEYPRGRARHYWDAHLFAPAPAQPKSLRLPLTAQRLELQTRFNRGSGKFTRLIPNPREPRGREIEITQRAEPIRERLRPGSARFSRIPNPREPRGRETEITQRLELVGRVLRPGSSRLQKIPNSTYQGVAPTRIRLVRTHGHGRYSGGRGRFIPIPRPPPPVASPRGIPGLWVTKPKPVLPPARGSARFINGGPHHEDKTTGRGYFFGAQRRVYTRFWYGGPRISTAYNQPFTPPDPRLRPVVHETSRRVSDPARSYVRGRVTRAENHPPPPPVPPVVRPKLVVIRQADDPRRKLLRGRVFRAGEHPPPQPVVRPRLRVIQQAGDPRRTRLRGRVLTAGYHTPPPPVVLPKLHVSRLPGREPTRGQGRGSARIVQIPRPPGAAMFDIWEAWEVPGGGVHWTVPGGARWSVPGLGRFWTARED